MISARRIGIAAILLLAVGMVWMDSGVAQFERIPESIHRSGFEQSEALGIVPFLPPDPKTTWIPLDPTIVPSFHDTIKFLFEAPNPVQRGMRGDPVQPHRATVLRGRVLGDNGAPIAGVLVRINQQPQLGYTFTRADGFYDLVGNGGSDLVLDYSKAGLIRVQRRQFAAWKSYTVFDDIVMMSAAPTSQVVQMGASVPQLASGTTNTDADGTRRASVYFPTGVTAQALGSGAPTALNQITFRATEFTVGEKGPQRMPGSLPSNIAYTYAVELSADEAITLGASRVQFSTPLSLYLDNFLDVKVGEAVPLGYYDYDAGKWIGEDNGRVARVLSISDGLARIDLNGSGIEATAAEYAAFGVTAAEQAVIAQRFAAGQSFWRARISHFTAWDCNFPYFPQSDTDAPEPPPPTSGNGGGDPNGPPEDDDVPEDPSDAPCPPEDPRCTEKENDDDQPDNDDDQTCEGSILSCQDRTLREVLPIAGSSENLMYSSDRTASHGNSQAQASLERRIEVQVTPGKLPPALLGVTVEVSSFGLITRRSYVPAVNIRDTFTVRLGSIYSPGAMNGYIDYQVRTCYEYQGNYAATPAQFAAGWARLAGGLLRSSSGSVIRRTGTTLAGKYLRCSANIPSRAYLPIAKFVRPPTYAVLDQRGQGLGSFGLTSRHLYDPEKGVLHMGDGTRREAEPLEGAFNSFGAIGHGVFEPLPTIEVGGFGTIDAQGCYSYFQNVQGQQQVALTRRCPGGGEQTVNLGFCEIDPYKPGNCDNAFIVDPPTGSFSTAGGTTFVFNGYGIYQLTPTPQIIYRVDRDPIGNCIPAAIGELDGDVIVACNVPFKSTETPFVARLGLNNRLQRIAGGGDQDIDSDPLRLRLSTIYSMRVSADNLVYLITDGPQQIKRALRFGAQNQPEYLAPRNLDNQPLSAPVLIAPGIGGYHWLDRLADATYRIHAVNGKHVGQRLLDPSAEPFIESKFVPQLAFLNLFAQRSAWTDITDMQLGPDGSLFVTRVGKIFRYGRSKTYYRGLPEGYRIPSKDGSMVYVFDAKGRHLETRSKLTGAVLQRFVMDAQNRVAQVIDGDGDTLSIIRSPNLVRFVAPDGQISELTVNPQGYATDMRHIATNQRWQMRYDAFGLMTRFEKPKGNFSTFVWNEFSRIKSDTDSGGGQWTLEGIRSQDKVIDIDSMSRLDGGILRREAWNTSRRTRRVNVLNPDNTSDSFARYQNLSSSHTHFPQAGGSSAILSTTFQEPDPLFGFSAPVDARTSYSETGVGNTTVTTRIARSAIPVGSVSRLGEINLRTVARTQFENSSTPSPTRFSESFYDSQSKTVTTSGRGIRSRRQIDAQERTIRQEVDGIAAVNFGYDARGRLQQISSGSGTDERVVTMGYDAFGYVSEVTDPLNRKVLLENDAVGRTVRMTLPDKRIVEFDYDPNDNLIGIKPPGRPWHRFEYGQQDELRKYLPPTVLNTGKNSTDYSYNKVPQPLVETRPGGETLTAVYQNTLLKQLQLQSGSYMWEHSGRRPITQSTPVQGACAVEQSKAYSGYFVLQENWRQCGATLGSVERTRNGFYEVDAVSVKANAAELSYRMLYTETTGDNASSGRSRGLSYGGGSETQILSYHFVPTSLSPLLQGTNVEAVSDGYAYNGFGEHLGYVAQINLDPKNPVEVFKQNFVRDKLGRISEKTEVVNGVTTVYGYEYDLAGRLEKVSENGVLVRTYGFDANSNRISLISGATTITGTADDQDRLLTYGSNSYSYAENGETRTRSRPGSTRTFNYDVMGNLQTLADGALALRYGFDAQGRRMQRYKNGALTHSWLYLDQLRIAGELNPDGSLKQQFAYGEKINVPSMILRKDGDATVAYRIVSDHLGSVRLVVRASDGVIVQRMRYDEYGQVLEDTNPGFQPFGYAGGLYDPDTGLVRFGARDYDPEIGRWLAKDPIGFEGGLFNVFSYIGADPINFIDPSGLCRNPGCYERCVEEETIFGEGGGAVGENGQIAIYGLDMAILVGSGAAAELSAGVGTGAAAGATGLTVGTGVAVAAATFVPFFEITARLRCSVVCGSNSSYY